MAVTLPLFINAVDYNAETERRGFSGLLVQSAPGVARSGVLGPAPSVSLSGSTVQVGPFNAAISSAKGAYLLSVDSVTSAGTVGVADATNPRLDRIVLEVLDPDNGSGGTSRLGRLRVIPGTAAALPGLPPLPALALHVGQVQVPKSGGGNAVITVDPQFTATAGAPVPVRNVTERAALTVSEGLAVQRLDLGGRVQTYTAGRWQSDPQIMIEGVTSEAPIIKKGTVTVASDGNGAAAYLFGTPFPNRILGATLTQVYTSTLGLVDLRYQESLSNQNRVAFLCYDGAGTLLRNVSGIRLVFDAVGD